MSEGSAPAGAPSWARSQSAADVTRPLPSEITKSLPLPLVDAFTTKPARHKAPPASYLPGAETLPKMQLLLPNLPEMIASFEDAVPEQSGGPEVSPLAPQQGGSLLERSSPRARKLLRSFLHNFLRDGDQFPDRIDLKQHSLDSGQAITDAVVQEVCRMHPAMRDLVVRDCELVTDVGLWAIAKFCDRLAALDLSNCVHVTNIGLRAIAGRCQALERLVLSGCAQLGDVALSTLAGGCWSLRELTLDRCVRVSDAGLAAVAKCCPSLERLSVAECDKIGEFGEAALVEIGRRCRALRHLDMLGCRHVRDAGVRAVAGGAASHLQTLRLSGCAEVTGRTTSALARFCPNLTDLSLAGCRRLSNADVGALSAKCRRLTRLDLSCCVSLSRSGLAELARNCPSLTELNLSRCAHLSDEAVAALAKHGASLRRLDLSHCGRITEASVDAISLGCTGLAHLDVSGDQQIRRRFLMGLLDRLEFCDPAHAFYGLQPKEHADALRQARILANRKAAGATKMQAVVRGRIARKRCARVREMRIKMYVLPKVQAIVRGVLARHRRRQAQQAQLESRCATRIRAAWKGLVARRRYRRTRHHIQHGAAWIRAATRIQSRFRAHRGRRSAFQRHLRRERQRALQREHDAFRARMATEIQRVFRGGKGRDVADERAQQRRRRRLEFQRRVRCATHVQRLARGFKGRRLARQRREEVRMEQKREEAGQSIQRLYRGHLGRTVARKARWASQKARERRAAVAIQSQWRACRGRFFARIVAGLAKLHRLEVQAATIVQRIFRGKLGRRRMDQVREEALLWRRTLAAVLVIQRVFRGHKGREAFEIHQRLSEMAVRAKPLYATREDLQDKQRELAAKTSALRKRIADYTAEISLLDRELRIVRKTSAPYWDSDRVVPGVRQRYVTPFLLARLEEQAIDYRLRLDAAVSERDGSVKDERSTQRLLRAVEREIRPLTRGVAEKTKRERSARLRTKVRAEKAAASALQRSFRGFRVRKALFAWTRDYWTAAADEATGDIYYLNTWSGEVQEKKPLEMALSESIAQA
eukprot:scaffold8168_cov239-Pinguiococcus_pyrenoidosus.AAC.1